MKRYWVAKYEKEASKRHISRKQELSKEVEALLSNWSSSKRNKKEVKRLFGCAKTQPLAFGAAMRKLRKVGKNLINIYLNNWMVLDNKPGKARKAFAALLHDCL